MNNLESNNLNPLAITCASGLETLLIKEIQALGGQQCEKQSGAVTCLGDLNTAYKICLWSRIASRVLWQIDTKPVKNVDGLYHAALSVPWSAFFSGSQSFRVNIDLVQDEKINSQYAAFKLKDAIRDHFQNEDGSRPIAVKDNADVVVHVYWQANNAVFSVDFAGAPLHQRGYRKAQGKAPLKETLAAAMLMWSNWPGNQYQALVDPFCGSGTLLIEAALLAYHIAPGLLRDSFALQNYRFFNVELWQSLVKRAQQFREENKSIPLIRGYDASSDAIKAAMVNIQAAGLQGKVHVERSELGRLQLPKSLCDIDQGLLVTNAPYGERIGNSDAIQHLYTALGRIMRPQCPHWYVGILSNQVEYIDKVGLETGDVHRMSNGPIRCYFKCEKWTEKSFPTLQHPIQIADVELADEQKAFANRLKKNLKPLRKWAEREQISCYRIYDADMPEFNVAIDWYDGELHVQEYKPPKTVDENKARQRLDWVIHSLVKTLDVPRSKIQVKTRAKQKGKQQYKKLNQENRFRAIYENGAWLLVNLSDYLDTGVFLDHRPVRYWIQQQAQGKRVLNLFSYTCAATVHAAIGGAKHTVSVDMSKTYLAWGRANLLLNGFSEDLHRLVQANCVQWLNQCHEQFDLIFMDPPTFSNSKRMKGVFDVQRDHATLIDAAMKRLEPGGKLLFSNNFKRFSLDSQLPERYEITDLTKASIPDDFKGSKGIHCCFEILHR